MLALTALQRFLPMRASGQLRELYASTAIKQLAIGMVALFEPIYYLQQGFTIAGLAAFIAVGYFFYFLLVPVSGRITLRYGYRRPFVISSFMVVGYYAALFALQWTWWAIAPLLMFFVLHKVLYWPTYHYDYIEYGDSKEEAREVSGRQAIEVTLAAVGPLLGGIIIHLSSFTVLYVVATILIMASNIPFLYGKENVVQHYFSISEAYKRFFRPEKRRFVVGVMADGGELVSQVFWPLFIFTSFVGGFVAFGGFMALSTLLAVTLLLYVGRLVDGAVLGGSESVVGAE